MGGTLMAGHERFLLELLSEEIPARMQAKASADSRACSRSKSARGLKAEAVETYATPRRLVLIARGLPAQTDAVSEEIKGPRTVRRRRHSKVSCARPG